MDNETTLGIAQDQIAQAGPVHPTAAVPAHLAGFPPKLFVIGAQKCGTTALCELLAQALPVNLAQPKEPAFFTRNFHRGAGWYRTCFTREDLILLDGTPSYTMGHGKAGQTRNPAAQRIRRWVPSARLIYVVRDPVQRAYAGYWHAARAGRERRPLGEAISEGSPYVRGSLYKSMIDDYLTVFPRAQLLCIDQTYVREAPEAVVRGVARWLGVPVIGQAPLAGRTVNRSYRFNWAGQLLHGLLPESVLKAAVRRMKATLPGHAVAWLRESMTTSVPDLDASARCQLMDLLIDDYECFRDECVDLFLDGRLPPQLPS